MCIFVGNFDLIFFWELHPFLTCMLNIGMLQWIKTYVQDTVINLLM